MVVIPGGLSGFDEAITARTPFKRAWRHPPIIIILEYQWMMKVSLLHLLPLSSPSVSALSGLRFLFCGWPTFGTRYWNTPTPTLTKSSVHCFAFVLSCVCRMLPSRRHPTHPLSLALKNERFARYTDNIQVAGGCNSPAKGPLSLPLDYAISRVPGA